MEIRSPLENDFTLARYRPHENSLAKTLETHLKDIDCPRDNDYDNHTNPGIGMKMGKVEKVLRSSHN